MTDTKTINAPREIRVKNAGKLLQVTFDDNQVYEISAELLRVESPSAEVQGHSEAEKKTIGGKLNVRITGVEPVGNYAVKLVFDDGHDTGLFTWEYLLKLGKDNQIIWADYLARLANAGLSRE